MKKIFFVAIAATLLAAGCQKTEIINQVNPADGASMNFAPGMGKLTKAAENPSADGLQTLKAQNFRLWAFYVADDPNRGAEANSIYDGMENINVTFSDNQWSTSPVHFWPGKDKELKFFAISADDDTYGSEKSTTTTEKTDNSAPTKVSVDATQAGGTLTVTNFVVSNEEPNVDLMIADYATGKQENSTGGGNNIVDLTFRHALAKVEFWFKNESAPTTSPENDPNKVIVQHMYVNNVVNKGTVTVANQASTLSLNAWTLSDQATDKVRFSGDYDGSTTDVPELSNIDEAENITQFVGEGKGKADVPTGHEMLLTSGAQKYTTWLVIPQAVGSSKDDVAGLKVEIAYLIGNRQFVASFPLYADNAAAWNPNQYIKYNISLSPNTIGFNPTVEEWATTSGPSNDGNVEID